MVGLAQAAALLLAIGLSWQVPVTVPDALPALAEAKVEVGEGQKVVIRSEGSKVDVVDLTALETPQSVPSIIPILPGVYAAVDLDIPGDVERDGSVVPGPYRVRVVLEIRDRA